MKTIIRMFSPTKRDKLTKETPVDKSTKETTLDKLTKETTVDKWTTSMIKDLRMIHRKDKSSTTIGRTNTTKTE